MRSLALLAVMVTSGSLAADDKKAEKPAKIDPARLVGKWKGTKILGKVPAAGESVTLEFTKDGKVSLSIVDAKSKIDLTGTYKVDGPMIGLKLNGREDKTDEVLVVKLTDTVLHTRQVARKENMVDEFERVKEK